MIKYNNSNINDWYFYTSDIVKVYRNNAVCYYKLISGGGQTPCFAVVEDIFQYTDTEFEDVFNKADGKWYKLNNLNQYEQYGVYGSSTATTYYDGKLVIQDGYEYQYSGSSWVNVGEVSGSSRVPDGYSEVEYIQNTGTTTSNGSYINTSLKLYDIRGNTFSISGRVKSEFYQASGYNYLETIINSESVSSPYYGFVYRYTNTSGVLGLASNPSGQVTLSSTANTDGSNSIVINCTGTTVTDQVPLGLFSSYNGNYTTPYRFAKATIYCLTVVKNGATVRDFVPTKRNNDSKYGLYDLISDTFYPSSNGNNFVGGSVVTGGTVYPMYYDTKQDPPDNLSFSSMAEAQEYECPWWGMSADIDNVDYMFCEGNEWLTKYTYIEVSGEYICDSGDKYKKMQEYDRIPDGTTTATTTYVKGDLIESASTDCQDYFVCLSDIVASSTTSSTDGGYNVYITPDVGTFTKIRIDTTKKIYNSGSSWFAFCLTPRGNEVVAINNYTIGETYGWSNKNYITDANGSQTFAHWVDVGKTIVEIDINGLSDGQTDSLYLLKYQKNTDLEFLYFNQ